MERIWRWMAEHLPSRREARRVAALLLYAGLMFGGLLVLSLRTGKVSVGSGRIRSETFSRETRPAAFWRSIFWLATVTVCGVGLGSYGLYRSYKDDNLRQPQTRAKRSGDRGE